VQKENQKIFFFTLPSRSLTCDRKLVQGERSAKGNQKIFFFALPSRSLTCDRKLVQGERSAKGNQKIFFFALPSRSLTCEMRLRNAHFPARITQDHPITTYPTPKPFFSTNDNFYSIALSNLYK
jgi:hypothetical protein